MSGRRNCPVAAADCCSFGCHAIDKWLRLTSPRIAAQRLPRAADEPLESHLGGRGAARSAQADERADKPLYRERVSRYIKERISRFAVTANRASG